MVSMSLLLPCCPGLGQREGAPACLAQGDLTDSIEHSCPQQFPVGLALGLGLLISIQQLHVQIMSLRSLDPLPYTKSRNRVGKAFIKTSEPRSACI